METNQQPPLRSITGGANSQFEEEGRYKPDPLTDYFDFILSVYSAGKLAVFAQQPFFCHPTGRRVEMSIECHQVSRQAAFEGLSLPHQFYSPFLGVAGQ
jgi:hypothetical protein